MAVSNFTKKSRTKLWICRIIDFLILTGPLSYYVIAALLDDNLTTNKSIGVVATVIIAVILVLFNLLAQKHLRSPIWIIFIGLYFAVDYILPLILMIAAATIIDEFILAPLIKYFKTELISNKTIDKRGL